LEGAGRPGVRALRTVGLVSSHREGKMVMYALTEPGRQLLATVLAPEPAVSS
jgi:DNA-binding transcriptional ArsR family regulator